jgi:hypothetical protein
MSRLVEVLQPLSVRSDRLAATDLFRGLERTDLQLAASLLSDALIERGTRMTVQGTPSTKLWPERRREPRLRQNHLRWMLVVPKR